MLIQFLLRHQQTQSQFRLFLREQHLRHHHRRRRDYQSLRCRLHLILVTG